MSDTFRFSLIRLQCNRYAVELSLLEISLGVGRARPLLGLGWGFLSGWRFSALYFADWQLPLTEGFRLVDFTWNRHLRLAQIFGRFNFSIVDTPPRKVSHGH